MFPNIKKHYYWIHRKKLKWVLIVFAFVLSSFQSLLRHRFHNYDFLSSLLPVYVFSVRTVDSVLFLHYDKGFNFRPVWFYSAIYSFILIASGILNSSLRPPIQSARRLVMLLHAENENNGARCNFGRSFPWAFSATRIIQLVYAYGAYFTFHILNKRSLRPHTHTTGFCWHSFRSALQSVHFRTVPKSRLLLNLHCEQRQ